MGQNMAGWAQLKVSGSAGTKVVMKYGERLNPDGTLDQKEIGKFIQQWEPQTDTYISKGKGTEFWEPRFVYHGFQYVQVTGLPEKPALDTLRGRVVHTSFEAAGYFECSNELFNKIQQNTLWSYISNFHGYPTDCPHREKNGWTGDAHLAAEQGLYNFASAAAYTKWMNDFKDEQRDSGELPGIVPTSGWGYQWGNGPAWDSAYLIIPWYMYRYCGDTQILAAHYDRFKRYVDYLTSRADNYTVSIGLGDWVPAKTQTPEAVTSTAFYYADAVITGLAGRLLGKHDEAEKYFTLARQIKDAWNKTFYKGDGIFANGSQTALSFALYGDLVPESERQKTLDRLVENIEKNNYNIDTGILGAKCIFTVLSENGRHDVAYKMATQTTYPSYGHWISRGATTLWEDWSGSASLNHIMLGDISAWFYKYLAGININPDPLKGTGFKHIVIRPRPVGDITWVRAEHNSMYGPIRSSWRKENGIFTLDVTIPVNTTAKVYMPANDSESVTEGGQPANKAKEVQLVNMKDGNAVFAVGSGQYRFASKLPQ
ncbi:MAG: family 78 glycoside hydrolase catalytic domain, partial [Planctomycetota bacterium]|nr:family 78 glycoside hydrolase catalytic domain [Planctomycetota bacterium]